MNIKQGFLYNNILSLICKPPGLCELTPIGYNIELTHFSLGVSKWHYNISNLINT